MAKDKGVKQEPTIAQAAPLPSAPASKGFETFDPEEAQRYNLKAGGHLISVTARYPSKDPQIPATRPGKRYRFLETKDELDRMLAVAQEGE